MKVASARPELHALSSNTQSKALPWKASSRFSLACRGGAFSELAGATTLAMAARPPSAEAAAEPAQKVALTVNGRRHALDIDFARNAARCAT